MKTVLVVIPAQSGHRAKLEAAGEGCTFLYASPGTVTAEQVAGADVIIGNVPAALIKASPRLGLLQLNSAGADDYIKPGILAPKTILANATGAYGKAVSEHALALTLMLIKKLHLYRDEQRKANWADEGTVGSIADSVVAVVGLGDIGLRYARMAKALGAYTIGVKRRAGACPKGLDELYADDGLDKVLARADIIASFLPGNAATTHLYNEARFKIMKPSAIFINCGRGGAVDSEALYKALSTGGIASAGLDVTELEPLPPESPLWSLKNLVITPHVSGGFHLPETFERIVDIAAENLSAYLQGRELKNIVDFETGYRK